ncbi:MAG: tetratricopeptide repeat protein [Gammaproteobacteria bacterium]|nr:tetratricopeptide repeat protein [Gammaproteobacteria bacterium]
MGLLRLNLLGRFEARLPSGEVRALPTRKAEALLAYLALAPDKPHSRERLTGLMWSDRSEEQARNSLRHALSALRKALDGLDPSPLIVERSSVTVNSGEIEVDALELQHLTQQKEPNALARATALYRGEFLEGMVIKDPACEEWLSAERDRCRRMAVNALAHLIAHQREAGEIDAAIETGERLVVLDPLRESAWRELMRAYAETGERNQALKVYKRCCEVLASELGVEPEAETSELDATIRNGAVATKPPAAIPDSTIAVAIQSSEAGPACPQLVRSERPSVVVLPIVSLGTESEQDYFADGLTEDIIISLAHYRELFVIDQQSAFAFREQGSDAESFARGLSVDYLTKGSVRRSGSKIRISMQLIEVATGRTVWADRMDREFSDLFVMEDEVVSKIASSLVDHIEDAGRTRAASKLPEDMTAFEYVLKARRDALSYDAEENLTGRRGLEEAIALDPEYAGAYAYLALSSFMEFDSSWCESRREALERGVTLARKAVALDEFDANAQVAMGWACLHQKKFDLAEAHLDRAIECNPNQYNAYCTKSWLFAMTGRPSEAMICGTTSFRLNPLAPDDCLWSFVVAHYVEKRYQEALEVLERMHDSNAQTEAWRAACLAQLQRDDEASAAAARAIELGGELIRHQDWLLSWPFKNQRDLEHLIDGLCKSGVLERPTGTDYLTSASATEKLGLREQTTPPHKSSVAVPSNRLPRKLAAILCADVVGYSRLMGADEPGTLERLKMYRRELIDPTIASHNGRIVKLMGDGALVEFGSVVDALACAVEIQSGMKERNKDESAEQRIEFRIGINLGDVMIEGDDIYGDGVNVAARLEGLADESGICISESVHIAVGNKLSLDYEDIGEQSIKNIVKPVRAYRVVIESERPKSSSSKTSELELPDKPSIAVLPFSNMSGDPEQEYFSDGITEGIILGLSWFSSLRVVSRHSSFAFKGENLDVKEIGKQLGVGYVVEGSVRKTPTLVRITAQLVDTGTGSQVWGKRFDSDIEKIVSLEDELTRTIVATVTGRIEAAGQKTAVQKSAKDLRSYDYLMRGMYHCYRFTRDDNRKARELLEQCIDLDPDNARAHQELYWCNITDWMSRWSKRLDESFERARYHASKALELAPDDSNAQAAYAECAIFRRAYEEAELHVNRAIELNPYNPVALSVACDVHIAKGNLEKAVELADTCFRLDPYHPWSSWVLGAAYFVARRYQDAIDAFLTMPNPVDEVNGWLAASYQCLGDADNATKHMQRYLKIAHESMVNPPITEGEWREQWQRVQPYNEESTEHFFGALLKAGLAEHVQSSTSNTSADHPSIAVLLFENLSGDAEQEYFAKGMTNTIATELSRIRSLIVKSAFSYKGDGLSAQHVAEEMGVDYLLRGTVQRQGDRVRVAAEFVDGETGVNKWSERFDRRGKDILEIQDDIAQAIVATLWGYKGRLQEVEFQRRAHKATRDLQAYDFVLRGVAHKDRFTKEDNVKAHACFSKARKLDPSYADAASWLSWIHTMDAMMGWSEDHSASLRQAIDVAKQAIELDRYSDLSHWALAAAYLASRQHDRALAAYDAALELNPNNADILADRAEALYTSGKADEAITCVRQAMQLNPYHPEWYLWNLGIAYYVARQYTDAVQTLNQMTNHNLDSRLYLAASYAQLGQIKEAEAETRWILEIDSGFTLQKLSHTHMYKNPVDIEHLLDGLRKAGLAEQTDTGSEPMQTLDKPSIAVLPFTNISGDPDQYFSDGITDDIVTNLSRFRDLIVIASHSSFAYKGKVVNIKDVSQELGVRYVLEGSVQKSNDRVRINAQLIDGSTGSHLWAERYDRRLDDIFKVQDEVVEMIVGTLASGYGGRLRKAWQRQAQGTRAQNAQAFDYFMRGIDSVNHFTSKTNRRGREFFEQAIELDPNYAKAYGKLAWTHLLDATEGWTEDYEGSIEKGRMFATKGIENDDGESWAHWALAAYYAYMSRHDLSQSEFEKAVELNPNDADVLTDVGFYLSYAGKAEEGLEIARKAMRLNPHYPEYYAAQLIQIYFDARQYEDAIATSESLRSFETTLQCLYLAASHGALGHTSEAQKAIERVLTLDSQATIQKWTDVKMAPYKNQEDLEHLRENLRKAGLPE